MRNLKNKIVAMAAVVIMTAGAYSYLCFTCTLQNDFISDEDYGKLSMDIVEQSKNENYNEFYCRK